MLFCDSCGTEFPVTCSQPVDETVPNFDLINLEEIQGAFEFVEGFSRPDWKIIRRAVESRSETEDRREIWNEAAVQC